MKNALAHLLTFYVIASIGILAITGLVFVFLAAMGVLSAEVRSWIFLDWYLGWGLIIFAAALAEAVMEDDA